MLKRFYSQNKDLHLCFTKFKGWDNGVVPPALNLEFGRTTLISGENGSGKTVLATALRQIFNAGTLDCGTVTNSADVLCLPQNMIRFSVEGKIDKETKGYIFLVDNIAVRDSIVSARTSRGETKISQYLYITKKMRSKFIDVLLKGVKLSDTIGEMETGASGVGYSEVYDFDRQMVQEFINNPKGDEWDLDEEIFENNKRYDYTIIFDEIEAALSPKTRTALYTWLQKQITKFTWLQIIIISHDVDLIKKKIKFDKHILLSEE